MITIHINNKRNKQKSGKFIALACGFKSEVSAVIDGEEINAKSIMKAPVIENAVEISFIINGEDEKKQRMRFQLILKQITKISIFKRMVKLHEENQSSLYHTDNPFLQCGRQGQ